MIKKEKLIRRRTTVLLNEGEVRGTSVEYSQNRPDNAYVATDVLETIELLMEEYESSKDIYNVSIDIAFSEHEIIVDED